MENIDEEWKEVWKSEYLKTIAAFHNTIGGRFIVGRKDNGEYVGVSNPHDVLKTISDSIHNTLNIHVNIRVISIEDKECIIADVSHGNKMIDYNGKYYERIGNTTQLIRGERLKDIFMSERNMYWMDLSSGLMPSDLSQKAIKEFVSMGKKIERIPKNIDTDDIALILHRYNLLLQDGSVSVSGSILFSEHPRSINRGAFLKIGEFDSDEILRREDIIETPLITLPNKIMEILFEKYIPPRFIYDGALRKLSYQYPVDGLRELIINAIVHMDYKIKEPVSIYIYPNRIEIFCYGGLPPGWTVKTLMGHHRSIPRNKTLADVFHDAGYVENWAQGIRKVISDCENNGNPPPEFVLKDEGLSATLYIASGPKTEPTIKEVIGSLSSKQKDILSALIQNPMSSGTSIASILGMNDKTVNRNLKIMHEMGLVDKKGERSHTKWFISTESLNLDALN
ncbi:MAG: putative DNA binding domain-containing protein [Candidatus Methanomethylophilaceae archaeon]|nr:putative DNA binding domain-containing protein [Candidatus Methanomethylophilaceae archaeon]